MTSKNMTCRLLADPTGPAAERFQHYQTFLNHNHQALRLISELEMLDHGARLGTLASIHRMMKELLSEVRGLVSSLEGISNGGYADLVTVYEEIAEKLAPFISRSRSPIQGPLVLPFSALRADNYNVAGAKTVNLARVRNEIGLAAPDGFVITTAGCDLFLRSNDLIPPIEVMLGEFDPNSMEYEESCRQIQAKIEASPMPQALVDEIDDAYGSLSERLGKTPQVAVRSSAVGEDTEASFAGQYRSILPVDHAEIATAFKKVLASKYRPRAILYRLRYGMSDVDTPMAVAVMDLVEAKASGVLYTVDATHPSSRCLRIDAALGMGENVVGGTASPDIFRIDRESLEIHSSSKGGASVGKEETSCISTSTAVDLAGLGLKIEKASDRPQDIEWAQDREGKIWILQARPLTITEPPNTPPAPNVSNYPIILEGGQAACSGSVSGHAVLFTPNMPDSEAEDAILVARAANPDLAPLLGRVRGLITDLGGVASHLASVARELNVPALLDTREGTAVISAGQPVTLLADEGKVYEGIVPDLAHKPARREEADLRGAIGNQLSQILEQVSPLNLIDPKGSNFAPHGCITVHDVIRFSHEKAMVEMFNLSELADASIVSRKMSVNIPLRVYFIDMGGGLAPETTTCDDILPEHIDSRPMAALWRGLAHPGVPWTGAINSTVGNFMTLMASNMGPASRPPLKLDSYALVSDNYLNLSVKFAYHYSNIDALCSDNPDANVIRLQFAGGAGSSDGKALRIAFLENVLTQLDYTVEVHGDMLQAVLRGGEAAALENVLDQTGRLLGCSRLLDMAIPSHAEVETMANLFFEGDYDLLGRSEKRVPGYYASFGDWSVTELDGQDVITQDGSHTTDTTSCMLHSALDKVIGGHYRTYLEKRHSSHYYPMAVKRSSRSKDARIQLDVRIQGGCIDLAAGLAFGLTNVGNCLILAADASAGEIQLLEFINNRRHFCQRIPTEIPLDRWLQIEVAFENNMITGSIQGRALIRFEHQRSVDGYAGLWTKGDTTAYFRNLDIDM